MPFTIKKIAMRLRNDSEYIPLPGVRGEAGPGVPAGGTAGQVLAKTSSTDYATGWVDAGGSASMTILSYGNSTWADFIAAYNANSIVYCRASSAADPSSGSQTRLAFMAYVNNASSPTSVEFQYYRSVSSHTDAQQGDQVYIYKLTSGGVWSVTVRETYTKIAAGTNMSSSYANGMLTLNATGGGGGTSDYDDLTDKPSINGTTLSGNKTAADLGLGTYSKPSGGIPASDLASAVQTSLGLADSALQSVPSTYRTSAAQDAIDADMAKADEVGIVITGKRPSMAVTAGQYVIVRNSTISGITDGLYTANTALSPSTDVTAANLTAVSNGGLNNLRAITTFGVTANSDALTSMDARAFKCGNLAFLSFDAVLKNQISAWTDTTIATITVTPIDRVYMSCFTNDGLGVNIQLYQNSNELKLRPLNRTIASGTGFRGTVMFFIN